MAAILLEERLYNSTKLLSCTFLINTSIAFALLNFIPTLIPTNLTKFHFFCGSHVEK